MTFGTYALSEAASRSHSAAAASAPQTIPAGSIAGRDPAPRIIHKSLKATEVELVHANGGSFPAVVFSKKAPGGGTWRIRSPRGDRAATECRRLAETLAVGEEKFRMLTEQTLSGVAICKKDGFSYVNKAFAQIIGYPREEVLSWVADDFLAIVEPEYRARIHPRKLWKARAGEAVRLEFPLKTGSGERKWLSAHINIATISEESAMIATVLDVTEKKEAEEARRKELMSAYACQSAIVRMSTDKNVAQGMISKAYRAICEIVADTMAASAVSLWRFRAGSSAACKNRYVAAKEKHFTGMAMDVGCSEWLNRHLRENGCLKVVDVAKLPASAPKSLAGLLRRHGVEAFICAPIRLSGVLIGFLQAEQSGEPRAWTEGDSLFVAASADQASQAVYNRNQRDARQALKKAEAAVRKSNRRLERMIKDRTRQLEKAQKTLIEKAHRAGMADIAVSTLHNIGNVLNSVVVSTDSVKRAVDFSAVKSLTKANLILTKALDGDSNQNKLVEYYEHIRRAIETEFSEMKKYIHHVHRKTRQIRAVLEAQHSYAHHELHFEEVDLNAAIEDALGILSLRGDGPIAVRRRLQTDARIWASRTKITHIMIHLLRNARESISGSRAGGKEITVVTRRRDREVTVSIEDTGLGISTEKIARIFAYGYSTKKGATGIGLHSCALFMQEMGGSISVESPGPGRGASFLLKFPLRSPR